MRRVNKSLKAFVGVLFFIVVIAVWSFPIVIAIHKDNYWIIFLYFVWWMPAGAVSNLLYLILKDVA